MAYPDWNTIKSSIFVNGRNFPLLEEDMPTFMGRPHAVTQKDLEGADVVIIGSPYATSWTNEYAGMDKQEWLQGPKRVRQQSIRYASGYLQEFDLDIFENLKIVDYGDADIPPESSFKQTVPLILKAQSAVEEKVGHALDAGALPIVLGLNSPCGSYAVAKPVIERTRGKVGVISFDTHWDAETIDSVTMDSRIAGGSSWKYKMYDWHENVSPENLVEIGERGMLENKEIIRTFLKNGAHFFPMWKVRSELGIEGLCKEFSHAYHDTDAVYVHYDLDILGGAGPFDGDHWGEIAEPIGMTDYEVLRTAHEIGKRGLNALTLMCIPPNSAVGYRIVVYIIMYLLAGKILGKN
jgi:agmatinase